MPLLPGTRLGPYEIVAALGAGGMGEVYRARDTRLERTVAIKVLPPALADDPEFKARFAREAKSISALNHPNICTLYDVGHQDGTDFLVMECLEGETLAARLTKGALPAEQALDYALQIADALDRAHRHGIVHRDLKPANVFLVKGSSASGPGICKLLDFGLAKVGAAAPGTIETKLVTSPAPNAAAPLTAQGSILGTFQYMAPEQIEGQDSDARTDIWAFGCVLYEMLTGRRAFEGKSQASLIAAILERQPTPVTELQPLTPPALGRIVRTCLEKHADDRFHTAHDLRLQLQWVDEGGSAAGVAAPVVASRRRHERTTFGVAALILAGLAATAAWMIKPTPIATGVVGRFAVPLDKDVRFTRGGRRNIAIAPDGTKIAFIANQQIYLRRLHETEAQPVRGTNVDPADLAFSPDGQWLAFFAPLVPLSGLEGAVLKKVQITGGTPMSLGTSGVPYGIRWESDTIVVSTGRRIFAVPENGGVTPRTLLSLADDSAETIAQPQLFNGGRDLLFVLRQRGQSADDALVIVQAVGSGERRTLMRGATDARLLASGHLVYLRDNTLYATAFDAASRQALGDPQPMIEGIRLGIGSSAGQYDVARNGTLVFDAGAGAPGSTAVWVTRDGRETETDKTFRPFYVPRISPDGSRIALSTASPGEFDLWIWDGRTMSRLTADPREEGYPVWSRDGKSLYYRANPAGPFDLFRRAADGTGTAEQLTKSAEAESPLSVIGDGQQLLLRVGQTVSSADSKLMIWPASGGTNPRPVLSSSVFSGGEVSPDGRWLVYQSSEAGTQDEIWVRPFPQTENGRWKISTDGGERPMWSHSGREIFYRTVRANRLISVAVPALPPGADFSSGPPTPVLDVSRYLFTSVARTFDIAPDDKRFVFLLRRSADVETSDSLQVIVNWGDELRARLRGR